VQLAYYAIGSFLGIWGNGVERGGSDPERIIVVYGSGKY